MRQTTVRLARKGAFLSSKALKKALQLTTKVENKATRLLNGVDFSMKAQDSIPLEKAYYNNYREITPLHPAMPAVGSKAAVVLLIPTLERKSFSGGTDTAVVLAAKLAKQTKRDLRIVQTLEYGKNMPDIISFLKTQGISFENSKLHIISAVGRRYDIYGYVSIHPDDIFMASAWWDAYLIQQLPLPRKYIYLIQDFEPIFYNNSDQYVLAESTYKTDKFIAICNTKLMYDFMKQRNYLVFNNNEAFYFEPAKSRIDSGVVKAKKRGEKRRLFLYGRPYVHRNLFFTALNAVDYAFKAGYLKQSEWELVMAGQDNLPAIKLSSGIQIDNLGMMSLDEYLQFSKSVDLAVSLMMAPHPNYPTLEFASIGSSVVTTKYANKTDLSSYSKNIFMSEIDVKSVAGAIKQAAKLNYEDRIKNARNSNIPKKWETVLDTPLKEVIKLLGLG